MCSTPRKEAHDTNEITLYNEVLGDIRAIMINNKPWFVFSDICKSLEISSTCQAMRKLDLNEAIKYHLNGWTRREAFITSETGLYSLIFSSTKPVAKVFKYRFVHELMAMKDGKSKMKALWTEKRGRRKKQL